MPSPLLSPALRAKLPPHELEFLDEVLDRYRGGWFPMNNPDTGDAEWVQGRRRGIIPLDPEKFKVSSTLRARVRSNRFQVTTDTAFAQVIRSCANPAPGREETWLDPTIIAIFESLHAIGLAHSIEAWYQPAGEPARLVGGLYGLALGRIFCGESMFSKPAEGGTDASKVCLVKLVHHLRAKGFQVLDAQLSNPHLAQFGLYEIPNYKYKKWLDEWADHSAEWTPWTG